MAWGGRELSPVGYGAFKIGRNEGIKYPHPYALPDESASTRLLHAVLDLGINLIDTAPAYGCSEQRIGSALAPRNPEFAISTKVGETFEAGRSTYDFSAQAVRKSIADSSRLLKRDVLDFVFIHAPREDADVLGDTRLVPALRAAKDAGRVRAIGFSGYTETAFRMSLDWADAIMVEYHLEERRLEPVMDEAAARGTLVFVKKGLASGRHPAGEAVRFVLSNPSVSTLLVSSLNLAHLQDIVEVARSIRPSPASPASPASPRLRES